jgi:hypothetical protein
MSAVQAAQLRRTGRAHPFRPRSHNLHNPA